MLHRAKREIYTGRVPPTQQPNGDGSGFRKEYQPYDTGYLVEGDLLNFGYAYGQHGCGVILVKDSREKPTNHGVKKN